MPTNVNVNAASNIKFCSEISVTNSQIKSSLKEMKCSHNNFQMSLRKVCKRGGMVYQEYPVIKKKKTLAAFLMLCCYTITNCFNSSD
jgi:hypothetical protein